MVRKKNHAIPNATTLAIGMSQNTNGMLFIMLHLLVSNNSIYSLVYNDGANIINLLIRKEKNEIFIL